MAILFPLDDVWWDWFEPREVWADEEFRRDFLATAREVAKETLDRLRANPRPGR